MRSWSGTPNILSTAKIFSTDPKNTERNTIIKINDCKITFFIFSNYCIQKEYIKYSLKIQTFRVHFAFSSFFTILYLYFLQKLPRYENSPQLDIYLYSSHIPHTKIRYDRTCTPIFYTYGRNRWN